MKNIKSIFKYIKINGEYKIQLLNHINTMKYILFYYHFNIIKEHFWKWNISRLVGLLLDVRMAWCKCYSWVIYYSEVVVMECHRIFYILMNLVYL